MGKVTDSTRVKTATVIQSKDGQKDYRFPMPDKNHARLALAMVNRAKGLSSEDKSKIIARAHAMLGEKKHATK